MYGAFAFAALGHLLYIPGASLERKGWLKNDLVNLLNTLVAALVAVLGYCLN